MRPAFSIFLFIGLLFFSCTKDSQPTYLDSSKSVNQRVDDLIERMTLEEKVAQLEIQDFNFNYNDTVSLQTQFGKGMGMISSYQLDLKKTIESRNIIQKYLNEKTRLGIPVIFLDEGLHGLMKPEATSFPQVIGLACSWDKELIERIYSVVALEMRSRGAQFALSPVLDVCRDPRWGRVEETYGEDPFLNGILASAAIKGYQGSVDGTISPKHVAATLKHFTGHGQPESGLNISPANYSERVLREFHMKPFKMAIDSVKPYALMASYNEIDGVPSHANKWLLTQVLRKEWGYNGLIVSDYGGIDLLLKKHFIANDSIDASLKALQAGVETDLPGKYFKFIPQLVKEGMISETLVDKAVSKILRLKFELGLFENPYSDEKNAREISNSDSSKKLALEAAQKSIVLLKNENGILPLQVGKYKKIAVVGPCANDVSLGGYPGGPYYKTTILQGVRNIVGNTSEVVYAKGCTLTKESENELNYKHWQADSIKFPTIEENLALIREAFKVAEKADIIILCVGENEYLCREAWSNTHLGDASTLDLICQQNDLAEAMVKTGKPVIACLSNGRPLSVNYLAQHAIGILECWYMGQETGTAIADILFGNISPSGKLTITFPRSVGQLPMYYNHKPSAHQIDYMTMDKTPLFPFGFGLSYTSFSYGEPKLSSQRIKNGDNVWVSTKITNTGKMKADEIVQLYIRDKISSVSRPVKELKGFQRISLDAGESKQVTFNISSSILCFYNLDMKEVVEPGEFEIMIGSSSENNKITLLTVE